MNAATPLTEFADLPPEQAAAAYILELELAEIARNIEAAHRKLHDMAAIDSAAWTGRGWAEK